MKAALRTPSCRRGVTLTELVTVIALCAVMALVVATLLIGGHRHWKALYHRVHRQERIDAIAVHRTFDAVCRKSSCRKATVSDNNTTLELYYWDDNSPSLTPEHYVRFYQAGNELRAEYGLTKSGTWTPDASQPTQTSILASNVQQVRFTIQGAAAQMIITFVDDKLEPLICSAVRYNY